MWRFRTGEGVWFLSGALTLTVAIAVASLPVRGEDKPGANPKPIAKTAAVSFTNDLLPVFTKLGCSSGACHGQQNGKGGFKLSLRDWDAAFDYEQITKEANGRRINATDPTASILLRKPTGQMPHGGGALIKPYSPEYNLLTRWLTSGRSGPSDKEAQLTDITVTPNETLAKKPGEARSLTVTAHYSDKTLRDVTKLARYQSQNDTVAAVDDFGKVTVKASGECTILVSYGGLVRTANVVMPFGGGALPSKQPALTPVPSPKDGRGGAINVTPRGETGIGGNGITSRNRPPSPILGRGDGGEGQYIDLLTEKKLTRLGLMPADLCTDSEFIRRVYLDTVALLPTPEETRRFLADKDPNKRAKLIDRLLERPEYVDYRALKLADLLRVNGLFLGEEGADVFYRWIHEQVEANAPYDRFVRELLTARGSNFHVGPANFYRIGGNPEELAETTAQAFLGTRIACAKCHNHPFENWKQSDYYGLAAFFGRFGRKGGPEFAEEQVFVRRDGEVQNPRTKQNAKMRYLGGAEVTGEPDSDRRATLAKWLTATDNRQFARVAVNRLWSDYFGRGIVDPVDDFRISNPPANAELLDALTDDFIKSGYDLKAMARKMLNSRTYQRSSVITPGNARDDRYFARAYPRRLPAEALLDAVAQVTAKPDRFWPYPDGWRATQIRDSRNGHYFLEVFGRPKREILCACERSPQPNLSQSLHLMNSGNINGKVAAGDGRLAKLLKKYDAWAAPVRDRGLLDELYYTTLCRPPSADEAKSMLAYVAKQKDRAAGFQDVLWALLNSEEFLFQK